MNRRIRALDAPTPRCSLRRDEGAGMVEYALLVLLVAVALIGAVTLFTTGLSNSFTDSASVF